MPIAGVLDRRDEFATPALARFPLERNRSSEKKSRHIKTLERILIAKVCQLLRNSLQRTPLLLRAS